MSNRYHNSSKKRQTFMQALANGLRGVVFAFHTEINMQRHIWLFTMLGLCELILRPTMTLVAISIFTATCVFAAELFNTAIEHTVDLAVESQYHRIAGIAKDVAAGGVALVAFGSLFVGAIILASCWPWHFWLLSTDHHVLGALFILVAFIVLWMIRLWPVHNKQDETEN